VLAADTVVVVDGLLLGKPADAVDAKRMLALLSGREHEVVTAVVLARTGERLDRVVSTRVTFLALGESQIDWYVATGEPFDKAGGYGLQGRAAAFISTIAGSHTNVIGLPLAETCELLDRAGLAPWGG
jgi:septum formation protein